MTALLLALLSLTLPGDWQEAFSAGEWTEALESAGELVSEDPDDPAALAALSLSYAVMDSTPRALLLADSALALDSLSALAWTARGRALLYDSVDVAFESFTMATDLAPGLVPARVGLAQALSQQGMYERASEVLEGVLADDPGWISAWLQSAVVHQYRGDLDKSRTVIFSALDIWPDNLQLLSELAWVQHLQYKDREAESTYLRIAELYPEDTGALVSLGLMMEEQERMGEAVKVYRRVLERDPSSSWAYGEIGYCLEALGNVEAARESYLGGLEVDPGYAFAMYRLAGMAEDEERYGQALEWYSACVEADPSYTDAWVAMGLLHEALDEYGEAEESYRGLLEADPENTWGWGELGLVLEEQGRPLEAAEAYERGIALDSSYTWAWEQRGLLLEEQGEVEAAIEWYTRAVESHEPSPWLLGELGYLLEGSGMPDSAASRYRTAIGMDSTYLFGLMRLAPLEAAAGDTLEALSLWEDYRRVGGDEATALAELSYLRSEWSGTDADSLREVVRAEHPGAWMDAAWARLSDDPAGAVRMGMWIMEEEPPDSASGWTDLALLFGGADEHVLADECFGTAVSSAPDDPDVWSDWGLYLFGEDREEEAAEKYAEVVRLDSLSFDGWSGMGEALLFSDHYEEAEVALARARELDSTSVWVIAYQGLLMEQTGRPQQALDHYFEALSRSPGYDYAESRIREVTDTAFDAEWNRRQTSDYSLFLWADARVDEGNIRERDYGAGLEASARLGDGGSVASVEMDYSYLETTSEYASDYAWSGITLSLSRNLSDNVEVEVSGSWDRQPGTVRPWQISSYLSIGYARWIADWLWLSPSVGLGLVNTHWSSSVENERTDRTTFYGSMSAWLDADAGAWPSLWLWGNVYAPPDDGENIIMNGLAELELAAWDPLSLTVGYSVSYTRQPVISYWDKYETELYTRLVLRLL